MDYLSTFYFIMLSIFVAYVAYIWIRYGVQRSISDSWYRLPQKQKLLFTAFCWGFAIPAIMVGVDITNNFLMFFAGAGIVFVGGAVAFKQKITKLYHMIGAYGGVAFSQLSIVFDFKMYYVTAIFILVALLLEILDKKKIIENKIWWQEILAFASICYVLGIALFK